MLKSINPAYLLCLLFLLLASCKEDLNLPVPERLLTVHVVNTENSGIPNAEVHVYTSARNLKNEENAYATGITDKVGEIHFTGMGADSLWIKATWIDLSTRKVHQNTMVSFEPVSPLPADSRTTFQVKVKPEKTLKSIVIKQVKYISYTNANCDQLAYWQHPQQVLFCNYYRNLYDASGIKCDFYLVFSNAENMFSTDIRYRSEVKVDVNGEDLLFEVNDTITDFTLPYFIGVKEHLILNPAAYTNITCNSSSSPYANLEEYLASEEGKNFVFNNLDKYKYAAPLYNSKESTLPSYPAQEYTIDYKQPRYQTPNDGKLKLYLEWIYE